MPYFGIVFNPPPGFKIASCCSIYLRPEPEDDKCFEYENWQTENEDFAKTAKKLAGLNCAPLCCTHVVCGVAVTYTWPMSLLAQLFSCYFTYIYVPMHTFNLL